jgi:plastocyanin
MKYFLSILAVLVFVGAGCAGANVNEDIDETSDNKIETVEEETVDPEESAEDGEEAAGNDSAEEVATEETTADGTDTAIDLDSEADNNTTTEKVEGEKNDEGIVEIVLGGSSTQELDMESGNFFFSPETINASPGEKISITFSANSGFHTFVIDEIDAKFSISEGEAFTFTAPEEPGSYAYYCDIGSHRAFGMEGVLIVE